MPWYQNLAGWVAKDFRTPARSGNVLLWLLRGCFGALIIGMALFAFPYYLKTSADWLGGVEAFAVILAVGALIVITDILVRNKQITTVSAIYFGLLLGLLLGTLFYMALEPFLEGFDKIG